ncbi:MAG: ion transporter [Candidatus Viridilinea halotolerans]|uniref:Ion transporter n=1 Tax=Candidatus Viridilinea halotolerans TaxID=2491704 RepID=A0A426UB17_9CHLR|nr:MAG: ion transporter [Candidatus Viridilinea halotolerans]
MSESPQSQHEHEPQASEEELHAARWELLKQIDQFSERPLIVLSFVWLGLLIIDFIFGLTPLLQTITNIIWILFVIDFTIELIIAPRKFAYVRGNWLGALSLLLPALRGLRIFPAFRLARGAARTARSLRLFRLITSLNRGMRALGQTLSKRGAGYIVILTIIVTVAGAAGMAVFESPASVAIDFGAQVEPGTGLKNYADALWWTAMIMTTLGSEYWPQTTEGRILGWMLSIYAFTIFGYLTAILASIFIGQDRTEAEQGPATAEIVALHTEIKALRQQLSESPKG